MTTITPSTNMVTTPEPPPQLNSAVIGVVIVLVVLTLAGLGFLLIRYLCHNKGAYRTTGEPAPGEELEQGPIDSSAEEKKEYFI
ncbi:glycophorin-C isoform X2 [Amia ocellicauda]|uniref:glycophorin-C isoform X2 n=1 Tax=Amia ocellicauda TaxID=2972642 RepID=UPI003463C31E